MQAPDNFTRIVDHKRYSTKTATLIAGNDYWDGHNFERDGTNTFLYRTPNGAYFCVNLTRWQGQRDTLEPVTQDESISLYEKSLSAHRVSYQEAFPEVQVVDA
jgi:hypothetical protein